MLFGIADLFALMLVILPLYPNSLDGRIYSVNLLEYAGISSLNLTIYWTIFLALVAVGVLKFVLTHANVHKGQKFLTVFSMALGIAAVIFLILTRQVYATIVIFALFIIKGLLYLKYTKG